MKIGISCYPTYGGSGVVATELGKSLASNGHEIHFISYSQPFRLTDFQELVYYHEVNVTKYPLFQYPPYSLALASKMAEIITREKLELLHVHYAIPHAACAYLAKQLVAPYPIKIVTTLHGTDITLVGSDPSFYTMTKFSIEQSDGITAVSKYLADRTSREFAIKKEIAAIPNFINGDYFRRTKNSSYRKRFAPHAEKIVCHISNFRSVKRVGDVIATFAGINKKIPCKLLMIGDGPDRVLAQELALKYNIVEHVQFLGKQDRIVSILSISDLFLLPSEEESFGLAALEAMSCHVPVIGTNTGGLPEVVKQGETGFLHPIGDTESMIQSGLKLLQDETIHRQFSQASRNHAIAAFDANAIVKQYESYYVDILNH